jgi:hypothetical protein
MKRKPNNFHLKKATKKISLYPLDFEEALSDLLKVKPEPKPKSKRKSIKNNG